jgi:CBS domain-containing protein
MERMRVEDIMTCLVVKLSPKETMHEAAATLAQNNISGAPVVEDGKVIGIVSEADLMRAAIPPTRVERERSTMSILGQFLSGHVAGTLSDVRVRALMSEPVVTVTPSATFWDAASIMERHGVKRLPVTDHQGNLVGIVSRADLIAVMARTDVDLRKDVVRAIGDLGADTIEGVEIEVLEGVATFKGHTDRRTTRDLALKMATTVPGIVEVVDRLAFQWDDTRSIPRQKDPWAVGPLVKGA